MSFYIGTSPLINTDTLVPALTIMILIWYPCPPTPNNMLSLTPEQQDGNNISGITSLMR